MIVSDWVYNRMPQIWLVMGILFLLFGIIGGFDTRYFYAYPLLGAICLARSFQIYQYRRRISRRDRINVLTETQRIERDEL